MTLSVYRFDCISFTDSLLLQYYRLQCSSTLPSLTAPHSTPLMHEVPEWVWRLYLYMVRGLTIWVDNRSNRQSTTIIFIWLDRLIIDAMSGGVGVGVYPSWRQQRGCRGQPISAGLAHDLCVLCCAIWRKAAPIDPLLYPMQVRSRFCPCQSSILVPQSGWAAGSGVPSPHLPSLPLVLSLTLPLSPCLPTLSFSLFGCLLHSLTISLLPFLLTDSN